jgi:hypothetical protein
MGAEISFRPSLWTVALGAALVGCGDDEPKPELPAVPIEELVAQHTDADVSKADPTAAYWQEMQPGLITMMAQPMVAPRPETTTTEHLEVMALSDGKSVSFRLRWKDTELSEGGRPGEQSDAVALEFPVATDHLPPVMMGAKDDPVHLFHWRAQYQRDMERGKPEIKDLYPNASIDMYPMDFKEAPGGSADDKQSFSPGLAVGNPQSYSKTGLDEIIAEGFSTSSVEEGHGGTAKGVWKDGYWTVAISRPLAIDGGNSLSVGGTSALAFAVWQGGAGEVASRKCVTMTWLPLKVM